MPSHADTYCWSVKQITGRAYPPDMRLRHLMVLGGVALIAAACGGSAGPTTSAQTTAAVVDSDHPFGSDAVAFVASNSLAVGTERLLVAVTDDHGRRLPSPDIPVTLDVWLDGRDFQRQTLEGSFMWAIPDVSGLYRATVEFDTAGTWVMQVTPGGAEPLEPVAFAVAEDSPIPAIGEPAPRSDTLTSADAPIAEISSDVDPDPSFYEMSIADAVTSGRPSVIILATPRFCTTGICQPTLTLIRDIAPDHPDVNFVHVEVFTNINDPDNIVLAPAIEEWGLPSEPWVFVVDADGIVVGRFEGVVTEEELEALLG